MISSFTLDVLTDEDLDYILKQPDNFDRFLEPFKKAKHHSPYRQFDKYLGTKDKKSTLTQKYLPKIVKSLYEDGDIAIKKLLEETCLGYVAGLQSAYEDIYKEDFSEDTLEKFSVDNYKEFIETFIENSSSQFDITLFWIQLKLSGVSVEDSVKEEVTSWYKEKYEEEEETVPDVDDEQTKSEDTAAEKKKKPGKSVKKPTAAEKEAKRKAAEALKKKEEKEKMLEEPPKEEAEIIPKKEESPITIAEPEIEEKEIPEPAKEIINDQNDIKEENAMHAYVGIVNVSTGNGTSYDFYNFNPIGELNGNRFIAFRDYELDMKFPDSNYRSILLFYTSDQAKYVSEHLKDGILLILEYEVDELEANYSPTTGLRNNTGYKVKVVDGFKSGRIRYLWQDGFYAVRSSDILRDEIGDRKFIRIEDEGIIENEKLFLELEKDTVVGPFTANYKYTLDSYTIEVDAANSNHILNGYNKSDMIKTCFERTFFKGPLSIFKEYYYSIPEGIESKKVDVISDKDLLESFSNDIRNRNQESIELSDLPSYIQNLNKNLFAGEGIPEDIVRSRYERIERLLAAASEDQESHDTILNVICDVLIKNKDDEKVDELVQELLKRESFVENLQSIKYISEQIKALKDEKNTLEEEKKDAQFQKEMDEHRQREEYRLSVEVKRREEELEQLEKRLGKYREEEKINKSYKQLEEEVAYLTKHKENLSRDVKELELSFTKMINDSSSKMADVTFDGFVSSRMIEAASKWDDDERAKKHEALVDAMNEIKVSDISGEDLIDYLVSMIQISRPHYTKNMIINLMICSMQGTLTVFAGPPGCGKTSICNIIAQVLGTRSHEEIEVNGTVVKPNRFVQVSVERGWTSKRDFIGYYNPLTKTFEENNHEVFDGLKLLNTESRKGILGLPFIILLDEANLSPMEYYWADFMNVCDDLENNHNINLGNNNIFEIPETLHFLATINNDHTTETLSPRLIDRAWVVTLPQEKSYIAGKDIPEAEIQTIAWDNLKSLFVGYDDEELDFSREAQIIYDEIKKRLADIGTALSIRTDKLIRRYCAVASRLMEDNTEVGYSSEVIALDFAISQKVLPKLSGNGEDYEQWLTDFRDYAKKSYLNNTAAILNRILENGKRQMKFYQFFN